MRRLQDTTAWTIGRIFEFLHDAHIEPSIITRDTLPPLISVLLEALKDASHIATRVCYALGKLAEGFKEHKGEWAVSVELDGQGGEVGAGPKAAYPALHWGLGLSAFLTSPHSLFKSHCCQQTVMYCTLVVILRKVHVLH